jgi:tRNA A-37 threonylcarbamoyl transferase component Bud32
MEAFTQKNYTVLRVSRARLHLAEGVSPEWARDLVRLVLEKDPREVMRHAPPPGWTGEAMVKIYVRRPKHNLLRLLRAGRSELEAAGYRAFSERGLTVPELILWGESRRRGLFEFGIVATLRIDAPSVAEAYAASQEEALLFATAEELGRIHKAGLAHGDPYARNFLATKPRPTPLDVASWSRLRKASQLKDLTRFACSIIKLTKDLAQARRMILHYEKFGRPLPVSMDNLINKAIAYAKVKKIRP